jgi:dihydrofolate reductase
MSGRPVVYYVAMSLDGFIADRDGGVGWLDEFQAEDYGYAEFYAGVGDIVMGRTTYEQVIGFDVPFPHGDRPVWVASGTLDPPLAADTVCISREPAAEVVKRLKTQATPGVIWLVGGSKLAASLWDDGLVDELRLFVMPVVLGGGIPLLAEPHARRRVTRTGTRPLGGGAVELRYRVG